MYALELEIFEEDLVIVLLQSVRVFDSLSFLMHSLICIEEKMVYLCIMCMLHTFLQINKLHAHMVDSYCLLLRRCLENSVQKRIVCMVLRHPTFPVSLRM